jgi:hypothetical protein
MSRQAAYVRSRPRASTTVKLTKHARRPVGVTVRVINPTDATVTLTGLRACLVSFTVVDARGRDRTYAACLDMREVRQVAPRDTLVENLRWLGWVSDPAAGGIVLAQPGRYGIRGELNANEGRRTTRPVPIELRLAAQR